MRIVERPGKEDIHNRRSPFFQVCGEDIFLTYNTDISDDAHYPLEQKMVSGAEAPSQATEWPLWIGRVRTNLTSWVDRYTLSEGLEPKLQALADRNYYEYFGRDGIGVWQIWTATSSHDLGDFEATNRTRRPAEIGSDSIGVEQEYRFQAVGERIYYAFPLTDEKHVMQVWTARANRDGSGFTASQATTTGGILPTLQVAGNAIYYMYAQGWKPGKFSIAKSDLSGRDWHVLAELTARSQAFRGYMAVDQGTVFFEYADRTDQGDDVLMTGTIKTDGTDLHLMSRSGSSTGSRQVRRIYPAGVQNVGNRLYYGFIEYEEAPNGRDQPESMRHFTNWVAWSQRDGTDWHQDEIETNIPNSALGYQPFVIVGGKIYYGLSTGNWRQNNSRIYLGTAGSNVINKGASFGIGVSEASQAAAFIDVGQDYLYQGTAPLNIAGTTARGFFSADALHQVAATFDGRCLTLFVDGTEVSKTPTSKAPSRNQFPLLLGDGFSGVLMDVRMFDTALNVAQIRALKPEGQQRETK